MVTRSEISQMKIARASDVKTPENPHVGKTDPGTCFICVKCSFPEDSSWIIGAVGTDGICSRCDRLTQQVFKSEANEIQIGKNGERHSSSCTDIEPYLPPIWDVNGYYRALGVSPRASRKEIRNAYILSDGANSRCLSVAIEILLNRALRAEYDACPFGSFFFDIFVRESIERSLHEDIKVQARDEIFEDENEAEPGGEKVSDIKSKIDQMMNSSQGLDKGFLENHHDGAASWGYYRWKVGGDFDERVSKWRSLLVNALSASLGSTSFGVGVASSLSLRWGIVFVGSSPIIFIDSNVTPSPQDAQEVADLLVRKSKTNQTNSN